MARPKIIEDAELIKLVCEYFDTECNGNPKRLKFPEIARYVQGRGYPLFSAETLRRTPAAREYIEQLQASTQEATIKSYNRPPHYSSPFKSKS